MKTLLLVALLSATPSPPPDATTTVRGLVNTKAQAFSGLKHFDGGIWTPAINGVGVETVANMTLYISPDGGNAGSCSQAAPCQTLNGALRLVPKRIGHYVQILPAPGLYPPEHSIISDFNIAENGVLEILGSWQTATGVDGGSTSGALSSVSWAHPFVTLSDSTQTWGTDTLKGKFVRVIPDGGVGVVIGNDATTMTLAGVFSAGKTPVASDAYELLDPAVVFQNDGGTQGTLDPIMIRGIAGRNVQSQGSPVVVTSRLTLQRVAVRMTGSSFTSVSVGHTQGPRIDLTEMSITGGAFATRGPIDALRLTQVSVLSTTSSAACSFSDAVKSWVGPTLCSSSTQPGLLVTEPLRAGFGTNLVAETTSASGAAVRVRGAGSIETSSSGSNSGLIAICPRASTGQGVWLGGSSGSFFYFRGEAIVPAMTIRNCGVGIQADEPNTFFAVASRFEHVADGGTPLAVSVTRGARVRIGPVPTFSGISDELRIDGTVVDGGMGTLNAATLQVLTGPYGSYISR